MKKSEDEISAQKVIAVHTVTQLDEVLDILECDSADENIRKLVGGVLDTVQRNYYLTPKSIVSASGRLFKRDAPDDAVTESVSKYWFNVSN